MAINYIGFADKNDDIEVLMEKLWFCLFFHLLSVEV